MQNPLEKYRSDHFFLLIGTNPLPNYVAAMLLVHPTGTLYLLHSDGSDNTPSTKPYAEFLRNVLKEKMPQVNIVLRGIHEADSRQITNQVNDILKGSNFTGLVGLNYTGGTKAMSVHTYRALATRFDNVTFSYLDAHKLAMRIEQDSNSTVFSVAQLVNPSLKELTNLHGYTLASLRKEPRHVVLFRALAEVHAQKDSYLEWKKWFNKQPLIDLPNTTEYPKLRVIRQAIDVFCGETATPELFTEKLGFPGRKLESCRDWLKARWLEELSLQALKDNALTLDIQDYGVDLKPEPTTNSTKRYKSFQLDVAAMLGYQLFAISCIRSEEENPITEHLFEVLTRAKQLGGDEARVGIVSLSETPRVIEQEIEQEWGFIGQVKVFGRKDLTRLPVAFADWFRRANL